MKLKASRSVIQNYLIRKLVITICAIVLVPGDITVLARPVPQDAPAGQEAPATIPADQLDSLVAPIALYPDPLLSQTLVASTYPLEIIQLQQWLDKNKNLKDQALADAVKKQDWDPSIQAMAAFPDAVKYLAENIKWTTDLGNAFLAQQSDVMDAVQRMRKKAKDAGNLKSTEQQKVETKVIESKQVIIVEQASPDVVYVPSYNPTVVYGAPVYPYPPIAYPPPGYYAAGMAISFGVGVAMGAAWGGGGWGWNSGWGGNNNIYVNNNNNFVNNSNRNVNNVNRSNVNRGNRASTQPAGSRSSWQHNPQHRGGAPYGDRSTANRFGGTARGDSMANRRENARQNQSRQGGVQRASDRSSIGGQSGARDRAAGGRGQPGASDRSAGGGRQPGASDRAGGGRDAGNRSAGAGGANRSGGGDRVGNRSVPSGGGGGGGAFGGGGSGSSARASSSRGSSSMGGGGRSGRSGGGGGGGGRRR
jgi:Protein of unknown function (DUF3300)